MLAHEASGAQHLQGVGFGPAPLRGTQSFVGVMQRVWKRPSLTGRELLWRWSVGLPLLLLAVWAVSRALRGVPFDRDGLEAMTVFRPVAAAGVMAQQMGFTLPPVAGVVRWLLPLALVVWSAAGALGRTAIWRRLDAELRPRRVLVGVLALLRSCGLLVVLAVWVRGLGAAGRYSVLRPAATGGEPNLVLFAALGVGLTLLLFMFWSLTSWTMDAAPLFAMTRPREGFGETLRSVWRVRALRSKLIETNLVMGIVKVALLVLATVFCACPLPFQSAETPNFLFFWWSFIGVLYLAVSDLFQVVRRATYLALFRALVSPGVDTTPTTPVAS